MLIWTMSWIWDLYCLSLYVACNQTITMFLSKSLSLSLSLSQSVVACNILRYYMVNESSQDWRNVLQPTQSQKPNSPTLEIKKPKTSTQHSPIQKKQTWNSSAKTFQNYKRTPKLFPNYIFAPKFFKITFFP